MLGEKRCFDILKSALKRAHTRKPDYVEFLLFSWESYLTRVANSQIHQNVGETEASLSVEIIHNLRIGSASTNILTEDSINNAIEAAFLSTHHKAELPAGLQLGESTVGTRKGRFFERTMEYSPQDRARLLKHLIDRAQESGFMTSAKFQTGAGEIAVANSAGTLAYTHFSDANLSAILTGKYDSSYASIASPDVSGIDIEHFSEDLITKAKLQKEEPIDLFQGKNTGEEVFYDVILEPYATAEWLEFLAYAGFNGLSYHEEESFLSGKLGTKVMGENINIWDDGNDPSGYVNPFDFEGTPKSKVFFIEKGIGRNVAYDGLLAAKEKTKTTGHSMGAGQRHFGAMPLNLFMEGGDQSLDYMIASSEEPTLYITRFHYTNIADLKEVVLTGMTKDGTFLVEKGEIVRPVVNLRYLQSVVEAFRNVEMLSEPRIVHDPDGYGAMIPACTVVPAIKIKKVRFIGSTGR